MTARRLEQRLEQLAAMNDIASTIIIGISSIIYVSDFAEVIVVSISCSISILSPIISLVSVRISLIR